MPGSNGQEKKPEKAQHPIVEAGKATQFSSERQPENRGRKVSIKKHIRQLLDSSGKLKVPKERVLTQHKDGSVTIELTTQEKVALTLIDMAVTGKGNIKAIELLLDHMDGKPKQTHAFEGMDLRPTKFVNATVPQIAASE